MKIAFYELMTTLSPGGIQTFNWEMAGELARRGHEVHLLGGAGPLRREVPDVSVFTFPFTSRDRIPDLGTRFRKFLERLTFARNALSHLLGERFDLIYVSKPFDIPAAFWVRRKTGCRVVFGSGGTEFFPGYKTLVSRLDRFFACSAFNARQIREYCGISPEILHNGVNTQLFRSCPPDEGVRREIGLLDHEICVVSACRLVGWKGIQFGIRAVAQLAAGGLAVKYVILGDGNFRKELEGLTESLGLGSRVMFLGSRRNEDLPKYYSVASAALFPSVADETFGISIAEAMACGIPIVATDVGGIPEVVPPQGGILVPPRDARALSEALETLIRFADLRRQMGRDAAEYVQDKFSWSAIANRFEECLGNGGFKG